MGVIAENPFAYYSNKSKFGLGNLFLLKRVGLPIAIPARGKMMMSAYPIPAAPKSGYMPIAVNITTDDAGRYPNNTTGAVFARVELIRPNKNVDAWNVHLIVQNYTGSQTQTTATVYFCVWYVKQDIIRVVS